MAGYYSLDEEREYAAGKGISQLKYMTGRIDSVTPMDLSLPREPVYFDEEGRYPHFRHMLDNRSLVEGYAGEDVDTCGTVLSQRTLKMIVRMPYSNSSSAQRVPTFVACLFGGVIYLTLDVRKCGDVRMCHTTYSNRVLQHLLSESPDRPPDPDGNIETISNFFGVFDVKYGSHRLLLRSPVDGVLADGERRVEKITTDDEKEGLSQLKKLKLVKLKTLVYYFCSNDFRHHYTRDIWVDSVFTNVSDVFLIWRESEFVRNIERYDSLKELTDRKMQWEPAVCMNFGVEFFNYVKQCLKDKIAEMRYKGHLKNLPMTTVVFNVNGFNTDFPFVRRYDCPPEEVLEVLPTWYQERISNRK